MEVKVIRPKRGRARFADRATSALAGALALLLPGASFAAGDAEHGATLYHDCMICHSLDKNLIGPKHRDVFGRKAASVQDYTYSTALKASNIVWDETTLDQRLTDPQAMVPGTKMMFSVTDAKDRADLIAFLKDKARSGPANAADAGK